MWLARDKDGKLYLYTHKPKKEEECCYGWFVNTFGGLISMRPSLFPEVTWENSPVEVELKRKS